MPSGPGSSAVPFAMSVNPPPSWKPQADAILLTTSCCLSWCHPAVLPCFAVQVDVTAQGDAADTAAPKWTKTASDEALRVKQGNQAANLISNALQNMGWGASPWAKLQGHIMRTKPHKVRAQLRGTCLLPGPGKCARECGLHEGQYCLDCIRCIGRQQHDPLPEGCNSQQVKAQADALMA